MELLDLRHFNWGEVCVDKSSWSMQGLTTLSVKDTERQWATLTYNSDTREFKLNIDRNIDIKKAPAMIWVYARENEYNLSAEDSLDWVRERIIPPDRQNINHILAANDMEEYDEYKMLRLCNGECPQDDMWIEEIS